jgi:glycosyltransferase involved in cell wall biosynthesis
VAAPRRILFVQHASALGGSAISLRYLMASLAALAYEPHVALLHPSTELRALYEGDGVVVHDLAEMPTCEHTTASWATVARPRTIANAIASFLRKQAGRRALGQLVQRVKPDLVHLNSAVLAYAAHAVRAIDMPFVWHVRESPVRGTFGVRTAMLAYAMKTLPDELIFISQADRAAWVNDECGKVIYNCVSELVEDPLEPSDAPSRKGLGIPESAFLICYVGGLAEIKGIDVLLRALPKVFASHPHAFMLMTGAAAAPPASRLSAAVRWAAPRVGLPLPYQRWEAQLAAPGFAERVRRLPFCLNIERYMGLADVLVFPAVRPHFARPVIEAAAVGVPTIASRLPGVTEIIEDRVTGLLCPAGDAGALAGVIGELCSRPAWARELGTAARRSIGDRFSVTTHVNAIMSVYDDIARRRSGVYPG